MDEKLPEPEAEWLANAEKQREQIDASEVAFFAELKRRRETEYNPR